MGANWFEKFMNFIGLSESYEDEEEEDVQPVEVNRRSGAKGTVLSLHTTPEMKIVVARPTSFEESEKLVICLKGRKPVIVNFEDTPKDIAQRIVDFLSGAVLALNGSMLKITAQTFLFVPSNVTVNTGEIFGEFRESRERNFS
ncbi:MAG: cell division protein SepF [Thermacetogeniaceae bacterium]